MHLTTRGDPCALEDGHRYGHRTAEGLKGYRRSQVEYTRRWRAEHPAAKALQNIRYNATRRGAAA